MPSKSSSATSAPDLSFPFSNRCRRHSMKFGDYPKAGSLEGISGFRKYVESLGLDMPCDDIVASGPESPLAAPLEFDGMKIGHRLGNHPMDGWDCGTDRRT